MTRMSCFALALVAVFAFTGVSHAWFLDFEWGLGHDWEEISSGVPGLQFTSTGGYDWLYSDVTTNLYNATSDNGNVYGSGEFFMSGDVCAWLGPFQASGRIDFLGGDGSFFTTGYSSMYTFYVEAYDQNNNLVDNTSGPANTMSNGGTGLEYLTVSSASNDIAYVMLHDTGDMWIVDNMSGDAANVDPPGVPEPATLLLLGAGLLVGGIARRKARK